MFPRGCFADYIIQIQIKFSKYFSSEMAFYTILSYVQLFNSSSSFHLNLYIYCGLFILYKDL